MDDLTVPARLAQSLRHTVHYLVPQQYSATNTHTQCAESLSLLYTEEILPLSMQINPVSAAPVNFAADEMLFLEWVSQIYSKDKLTDNHHSHKYDSPLIASIRQESIPAIQLLNKKYTA